MSGPQGTEPAEEQFKAEVRAFLTTTLPRKGAPAAPTGDGVARARAFQRRLHRAGFAGITWPREFGGRGLPSRFQRLFDREASAFELPPRVLEIGLGMCGPTILAHGTSDQKRRFLVPLIRGEHVWCELFSEPGAGSDLAGARMVAHREGEQWVVSGQKVWTSGAERSDLGLCLVRTNPHVPKRRGLSVLIVDMRSPGVTVRPLRQMTGDAQFNEVFLDEVRVPVDDVLGGVGEGWPVCRTMLGFERKALSLMGSGGGGRGGFSAIVAKAQDRDLLREPEVRHQLAELRSRQMVLRNLGGHLAVAPRSEGRAGAEASLLKLTMARFVQDSSNAAMDVMGMESVAWRNDEPGRRHPSTQFLFAQSASIGGGTNEIMRNVIAERALGLPREHEPDLEVPFDEVDGRAT